MIKFGELMDHIFSLEEISAMKIQIHWKIRKIGKQMKSVENEIDK
jgi:hypothetical protein